MAYVLKVEGLDEVLADLENAPPKLDILISRGLLEVAALFTETVQTSISTPFPPPSVPDEPPHLRTGALRRSVRIAHADVGLVTVEVGGEGTGVPYAAALEWGTSKMEPRPFVGPALNVAALEAADIVRESINRNLQDAVK